jgi:hypothetical protein
MPAGGLMQLVAYGAQDVDLTGDPKVTFFQSSYSRHTNFSMEMVQPNISGAGGNGGLQSVTISRSGDLVGDMFVALTPTTASAAQLTSNNIGADMCWVAERAFDSVSLYIGGQLIDKHYQTWFRLYSEVFTDFSKKINYGQLTSLAVANNLQSATNTSLGKVYLPLIFFFNRNPGLFLPLIALQYHEVRIDFQISTLYSNYFGTNVFEVWANYMYLDTKEREKFAKLNHEYLIEQVQHVAPDAVGGASSEYAPSVIRLQYNHPVKELIWCYANPNYATNPNSMWNFSSGTANVNVTIDTNKLAQSGSAFLGNKIGVPLLYSPPTLASGSNVYVNATTATGAISGTAIAAGTSMTLQSNVSLGNVFWTEAGMPNYGTSNTAYGYEVGPLHQFKLMLNGTDRFVPQPGKFFNSYQPYQYHSGAPYPGIYIYSFALRPEEAQPSGTCNFSRIDIAQAAVYLKTGMPTNLLQKMFAVNYNILRIQSGLGGIAFSN